MNFIVCLLLLSFIAPLEARGFTYEYYSSGYFTSIHVLTIDPKEHSIIPVKANGRETVTALAERYGALAGLNGGFWQLDGSPAGILKINNRWYGTPIKPRGAIGWSLEGQKVIMDRVLTNCSLVSCPDDEIEVVPQSTLAEDWKDLEHIVGGTPLLVADGNLIEDYSSEQTLESFLIKNHPRTAVGIKGTGEWVFVVVDGRFFGFLGGMPIKELAEFMLEMGCTNALNLDGGGSSTMVLEGQVVNEPCGKIEENGKHVEAVSDVFLIF